MQKFTTAGSDATLEIKLQSVTLTNAGYCNFRNMHVQQKFLMLVTETLEIK